MPEADLAKILDSLSDSEFRHVLALASELLPIDDADTRRADYLPVASRAILWEAVWRTAPWAIGRRRSHPYLSEITPDDLARLEAHPEAADLLRSAQRIESSDDWQSPFRVADVIASLSESTTPEPYHQEYLSRVLLAGDGGLLPRIVSLGVDERRAAGRERRIGDSERRNQQQNHAALLLYALTRIPDRRSVMKITWQTWSGFLGPHAFSVRSRLLFLLIGILSLACSWRARTRLISWCSNR